MFIEWYFMVHGMDLSLTKWTLGINKLGNRVLPRIPTWRVVELL
jgi:hypothetical protein